MLYQKDLSYFIQNYVHIIKKLKTHNMGFRWKKIFRCILNGVGSNILGYANNEVDKAVKQAISNSNISTLNCAEEVELCERLVDMHPWSDMARLPDWGRGKCNICKIARAASGKSKIAFVVIMDGMIGISLLISKI